MKLFSAKYRPLMILTLVFLVFISLISIFTIYTSTSIEKENQQIVALQNAKLTLQSTLKDVYELKLNYGADPRTIHIQTLLKRVEKDSRFFTQFTGALKNNQIIEQNSIEQLDFNVDQANLRTTTDETYAIWGDLNKHISDYVKVADKIDIDSAPLLETAINGLNRNGEKITNNMNQVVDVAKEEGRQTIKQLRLIQIIALIATLVFFIAFLFFLIKKILQADVIADEARKETTDILETVNEGLFLIDQDLLIGSQYSQALSDILGTDKIADRNLDNLLEQIVSPKDMKIAEEFIQQLFNERVKPKLIKDLNPLDRVKAAIVSDNGEMPTRYLKFDFSRVYDGEHIARVLVNVADITNSVMLEQRLEQERVQNDEQVEMLTAILKVDERMINSFLRNARKTTKNINNVLRGSERGVTGLQNKVNAISREAHSLKGEASALGLNSFVNLTEDLEDKVKSLKDRTSLSGDDFIPLTVSLDELIAMVDRVEELVTRIGGFSTQSSDSANTLLEKRSASSNYDNYFTQFATQVAQRNDKIVEITANGFDDCNLNDTQSDLLKELTIQLIRNAIVHGIESPEKRRIRGKDEKGSLKIALSEFNPNTLQLLVEDDGGGIDYTLVKKKLMSLKGLSEAEVKKMSEHELLNAVFSSGFSTLSNSTEDGGRGVGTDVIKSRIRALNGKFNVQTRLNRFTRFKIHFPKVISTHDI